MNKAIYYIDNNSTDQESDALSSIPEQAIIIPVGKVLDKETLLTSVAKACDFPSYFGHNWDALWDCLTDIEVKYLHIDLTGVEQINNEDFNVFKSIIEDAYKDFGQPQLWIVIPPLDCDYIKTAESIN